MDLTPKRLGMRLKTLRLAKRMSQDALARKAKMTREYVNKLEAGRYDPTIGVIQRRAKALKVNVKDLLTS
jgi:transcriptional regulator with XRE-family HTH domain